MRGKSMMGCGCLGALILGLGIIGGSLAPHFHKHEYVATVTEKQVVTENQSSKYLIFTKVDGKTRVFENTDSALEGKRNSSDVYGDLTVGKTYRFRTIGWRIPATSSYENIIKFEEVPANTIDDVFK